MLRRAGLRGRPAALRPGALILQSHPHIRKPTAMTTQTLEFFFDFGSPTTYLAHTQLPRIAAECGATLVYRPMLLGGVFKATGNASPVTVPAKGRWMGQDITLWARRYGVPFAFNPAEIGCAGSLSDLGQAPGQARD